MHSCVAFALACIAAAAAAPVGHEQVYIIMNSPCGTPACGCAAPPCFVLADAPAETTTTTTTTTEEPTTTTTTEEPTTTTEEPTTEAPVIARQPVETRCLPGTTICHTIELVIFADGHTEMLPVPAAAEPETTSTSTTTTTTTEEPTTTTTEPTTTTTTEEPTTEAPATEAPVVARDEAGAQTLCVPGTTICTKISLTFVNKPVVAAAAEPETTSTSTTTTTEEPTTTTEEPTTTTTTTIAPVAAAPVIACTPCSAPTRFLFQQPAVHYASAAVPAFRILPQAPCC